MAYTWRELTTEKMTNLFLYGTDSVPTDRLDDKIIRDKGLKINIQVDSVSYMADGPGRFATGDLLPAVKEFMEGKRKLTKLGERQVFSLKDMLVGKETNKIVISNYNYYGDLDDKD